MPDTEPPLPEARDERRGLQVSRRHTQPGRNPFDAVAWETRPVTIREGDHLVYHHPAFEAPASWDEVARTIAAQKYAVKSPAVPQPDGSLGGEWSVRQIISRITSTLRKWGEDAGYFATAEDAAAFQGELAHLFLAQAASPNSPVLFNLGRFHAYGEKAAGGTWAWDHANGEPFQVQDAYERPMLSACFIQSVEDTIDGPHGMMELLASESRLFKFGSGSGTNFSKIRAAGEPIRGGGTSSGLMSFLPVFDRNAGAIKSGGTTRRAAKIAILDIDHPEIEAFIRWKAREEEKARILLEAGIGLDADGHPDFNGEAYATVSGQNANNSVMVPDAFMQAAAAGGAWDLKWRRDGTTAKTLDARELWRLIAESAWQCADPGVMFADTIQKWNTCKADGRINSSNPCGEFLFLDESACNLASLNLARFHDDAGQLLVEDFRHAVRLLAIAMDLLVHYGSFPTRRIAEGVHNFRTVGLGYCNVGGVLLRKGLAYDSPEARLHVASVTSLMAAEAYHVSSEMAEALGAFPRFQANRESMLDVMQLHLDAARRLAETGSSIPDLLPGPASFSGASHAVAGLAPQVWTSVLEMGRRHGFRNAQTVVIAPTGTIGLLMGVDTTGIEPLFSLRVTKRLAGGGCLTLSSPAAVEALRRLGYASSQVEEVAAFIAREGTIQGAPHVRREHYAVFATAVDPGGNALSWQAHVAMTAVIQPFLSGGVSKTVNLPESATVVDIQAVYTVAHRLGLKNVAVYRDGCKASQPLNAAGKRREPAPAPSREEILASLTEDDVLEAIRTRFPHLARGYREPIPYRYAWDRDFSVKVADPLHPEGVRHFVTLKFAKDRDGRPALREIWWGAGQAGDVMYELASKLSSEWSRRLRAGENPLRIASENIGSAGLGGGVVIADESSVNATHVVKRATSGTDLVWRFIALEVYGKHDFVTPELYEAYVARLDRQPFIHEEFNAVTQAPVPRREVPLARFDAPGGDGYEPRRPDMDGIRCPNCGAGREFILVTGTCRTCGSCGQSIGGC